MVVLEYVQHLKNNIENICINIRACSIWFRLDDRLSTRHISVITALGRQSRRLKGLRLAWTVYGTLSLKTEEI